MVINFNTAPDIITAYLRSKKLIGRQDRVTSLEKPGEGNMNFVVRIRTITGSLILKQANPYVQRFPEIPAPQSRLIAEAHFYRALSASVELSSLMPMVLGVDTKQFILVLEDLGHSADFTGIYRKDRTLSQRHLTRLSGFLDRLHHLPESRIGAYPSNLALRKLNHRHMFQIPFSDDHGINLDALQSGLASLAAPYQNDKALKIRVKQLGKVYLAPGRSLLHGDFFPGSWLMVGEDVRIIDPEFSFMGPREFDLGVMLAHLKMAHVDERHVTEALSAYRADDNFDWALCHRFAAVEVMRRLLGLAQLPLDMSLAEKSGMLEQARAEIMLP